MVLLEKRGEKIRVTLYTGVLFMSDLPGAIVALVISLLTGVTGRHFGDGLWLIGL